MKFTTRSSQSASQGGFPLLHPNMHHTRWSQGQVVFWVRYDGLARNQGKANALSERGKQQMALHHGEGKANADARACAEWQVRVTGKLFLPFRYEALRVKFLRFRKKVLSSVQGVRSEQDDPTFG